LGPGGALGEVAGLRAGLLGVVLALLLLLYYGGCTSRKPSHSTMMARPPVNGSRDRPGLGNGGPGPAAWSATPPVALASVAARRGRTLCRTTPNGVPLMAPPGDPHRAHSAASPCRRTPPAGPPPTRRRLFGPVRAEPDTPGARPVIRRSRRRPGDRWRTGRPPTVRAPRTTARRRPRPCRPPTRTRATAGAEGAVVAGAPPGSHTRSNGGVTGPQRGCTSASGRVVPIPHRLGVGSRDEVAEAVWAAAHAGVAGSLARALRHVAVDGFAAPTRPPLNRWPPQGDRDVRHGQRADCPPEVGPTAPGLAGASGPVTRNAEGHGAPGGESGDAGMLAVPHARPDGGERL